MSIDVRQALNITMFDVGQAECFLLEKGQLNVLLDCGSAAQGKNLVKSIKERNIEKIDYVFITHPHEDHMGGMNEIIGNFKVGKIVLPNIDMWKITAKWYNRLMATLINGKYDIEIVEKNKIYNLDDVEIKVVSDALYQGNNINNYSTVLKISYGQNSIIMTGDAENQIEKEILRADEDIRATVLKVGHHGSKTATTQEFLDAIKPNYALISCGQNNKFNHPSKEVLERLDKQKVKIFRTDQLGTITLTITKKDLIFKTATEIRL